MTIIKFLTEHENIPNYKLKWKGNKVMLVNNFNYTGKPGVFVDGRTEVIFNSKEAPLIREKYERLY